MSAKKTIIICALFTSLCCSDSVNQNRQALTEIIIQSYPEARQEILDAFFAVERETFLNTCDPVDLYANKTHNIPYGQISSKPLLYVVMTQELKPEADSVVLEIGTGSGIQTAMLSRLCKKVYSLEISFVMTVAAKEKLMKLGYRNVEIREGDGYYGWPDRSISFDRILVTCSFDRVPQALGNQLREGGYLLMPVGKRLARQKLIRYTKKNGRLVVDSTIRDVVFRPMLNH